MKKNGLCQISNINGYSAINIIRQCSSSAENSSNVANIESNDLAIWNFEQHTEK